MNTFETELQKTVREAINDPDPSISHWQFLLEQQNAVISKLRHIIKEERAMYKDAIETAEEAIDTLKKIRGIRR